MARHEQLTVGQLIIESAIIDENGSTIVQDSASQSVLDSNVSSRTISTYGSTTTRISSAVTATSTVSAAISAYGDSTDSMIMSTTLSYETLRLAFNSSVVTHAAFDSSVVANANSITSEVAFRSSTVTLAAYDSSVVTNDSYITSDARWTGALAVIASDITAGSILDSGIVAAVSSYTDEGTDLSIVFSAVDSRTIS